METVMKQKNPLRVEQGKRLVEYNCRKNQELKNLNEQITKQDDMIERKPVELNNNYLYISGPAGGGCNSIMSSSGMCPKFGCLFKRKIL